MNEIENKAPAQADTSATETQPSIVNPFSVQPTGLVETTFAETLGLSMHNAISNQQSSQMTTSASITNACARLLQAPIPVKTKPEKEGDDGEDEQEELEKAPPKKRFNVMNFLKRKNKDGEQGDE